MSRLEPFRATLAELVLPFQRAGDAGTRALSYDPCPDCGLCRSREIPNPAFTPHKRFPRQPPSRRGAAGTVDRWREETNFFTLVCRSEDKQMLSDHLNFLQITARALEPAGRRD